MQRLIFETLIRPLVLLAIGLNTRHRERLPSDGPAIIVANHNSHLDTLVLMTLFPRALLPKLRPVAAVDYFFSNRLLKWFALTIIHIIPLRRTVRPSDGDPLADVAQALENGEIVILFPEGSRGEPEERSEFRTGVAHLAKRASKLPVEVPVVPVWLHGLGKALPRGDWVFVPFFCDVFVGESLQWTGDRGAFMTSLEESMQTLEHEFTGGGRAGWA